ncbi:MAG: hypothetical protein ACFB50_00865 [Rubrobacteraceae bacterium]
MDSGGKQTPCESTGTVYEIVVRGELGERFAVAFEGMEMKTGAGQTVLRGKVADQARLHGILARISGLGLELVSVEKIPRDAGKRGSAER